MTEVQNPGIEEISKKNTDLYTGLMKKTADPESSKNVNIPEGVDPKDAKKINLDNPTDIPPNTPYESEMLVDRDINESVASQEVDPDSVKVWQEMKERWENIGDVYERLLQSSRALGEVEMLDHMQQIDNAKNFIANARGELEKAFEFECRNVSIETKMPCPLLAPWMSKTSEVREEPRKPKDESDRKNKEQEVE